MNSNELDSKSFNLKYLKSVRLSQIGVSFIGILSDPNGKLKVSTQVRIGVVVALAVVVYPNIPTAEAEA